MKRGGGVKVERVDGNELRLLLLRLATSPFYAYPATHTPSAVSKHALCAACNGGGEGGDERRKDGSDEKDKKEDDGDNEFNAGSDEEKEEEEKEEKEKEGEEMVLEKLILENVSLCEELKEVAERMRRCCHLLTRLTLDRKRQT